MNRCLLLIFLLCFIQINTAAAQVPSVVQAVSDSHSNTAQIIPEHVQRLIKSYPEQKLRYENNSIIWEDGTSLIYNDGQDKSFEEMLDHADIEDMGRIPYVTDLTHTPEYLEDPGRIRSEAFYKKMYGENAEKVRKNLVRVDWFGTKVLFTRINGAAEQLERVAAEISKKYPEFSKYMKSSGTFYWRKVRHANRLSAHCYGIAIDIAVKFSDYWKWANPRSTELTSITYRNRIPMEIVQVFEKHGFIWGGRWYHFDTMHFEFAPEYTMLTEQPADSPADACTEVCQ